MDWLYGYMPGIYPDGAQAFIDNEYTRHRDRLIADPLLPEAAFDWPIYRIATDDRAAESFLAGLGGIPRNALDPFPEGWEEAELRSMHGDR